MKIDLPFWTYPVHLLMPLAFVLKEQCFTNNPPSLSDWDNKKWVRQSVKALALGTLFSTAIAAGAPALHASLKFAPALFTEGTIVLMHIFASTVGLMCYQALKVSDYP